MRRTRGTSPRTLCVTFGARVTKLGAWQDAHGIGAAIWNPVAVQLGL